MNAYLKRYLWYVICLIGGLSMMQTAQTASFDCAKVATKVEKLICDNAELSKLDDELSAAYKAALQDAKEADTIKQAQKQWMKERNGCSDAVCVKRTYEARLSSLAAMRTPTDNNVSAKHDAEQGLSTDDYVLDPAPKEMIDWNLEEYKKPGDKEVCSLYLQNLQYFARRNEPLSCGQQIAPMLKEKIKKVEWENLDPEKHLEFYKAIIREAWANPGEFSQKELEQAWHDIKEGSVVFRRLKFDLKGSPGVEESSNQPLPEQELSVVQFGNDVTRSDNPQWSSRCHKLKGRVMPSYSDQHQLNLFVVSKDLKRIYSRLWDWRGHTGQNLWLINERIYGEFYDENADVKLTELRATDFGNQLVLEPVCLYHFKKTSHKE
ncbi:MAG: lysozyme inhibitor LprI family protein [Gallionella sp.]|nr:lysozyme inhibitor LprI family protein [Gallionella sp.]